MLSEFINNPVKLTACGKEWTVQRLTIGEVYGTLENEVKQEFFDNVREIGKRLDPKDRAEFNRLSIKEIPSGSEMEARVAAKMGTQKGLASLLHLALSKNQKITLSECIDLVSGTQGDDALTLVEYVLGTGKDDPRGAAEKNSRPAPSA